MAEAYIEDVVGDIILDDADSAALVDDRIEPDPLSDGVAMPALTYKVVGEPHDQDAGTSWARVQVTAWGDTYAQIQAVSRAVRRALGGFAGVVSGKEIIQISYLNQLDIPDPATGRRTRPMDFQVFYRED